MPSYRDKAFGNNTEKNIMKNDQSKILIVDDQESIAKIIEEYLTINGLSCCICTVPTKVTDILKEQDISLMILDYYMPDVSGLEVLQQTRKNYSNLELPIIVITGSDDENKVLEVLQNDANDFITKPLNFDITLARIKTQLSLKYSNQQILKAEQLRVLNSMIITYNHEINTPLNIAFNSMDQMLDRYHNSEETPESKKLCHALESIKDITNKIEKLKNKEAEYKTYTKNNHFINIKKSS